MITYDTGTHELRVNGMVLSVPHMILSTKADNVDALLWHNVRLTAGSKLRATGALPFAIIASGSVTLEDAALIDVSNGGAGALQLCSNLPMPGSNNTGGAGGGGGGGYAAAGGDGGLGDLDGTPAQGGAKGNSVAIPAGPQGGCAGAHGGAGDSPGGAGGLGGGALYIAAADRIELLGQMGTTLTAGGGGGHGGTAAVVSSNGAGGGGGGSGGMIWIESPHVLGPGGQLAANGGGGGEGSSKQQAGRDGVPGSLTASRAQGGSGGASDGVDGGRGGSLEEPTGETVTARLNSGGGGGGGGVGYIHIVSPDVQLGSISPSPL